VAAGTTVLLTTQYLDEADRLADRIALIDLGRIITEGTTDQLKDRVGDAVVELTVADADRAATLATLQQLRAYQHGSESIVVPAPGGERSLHDVLHHIEAAGITATAIGLRKPTLDEAFLTLTGPRATPSPAGQGLAV
jgi:ABC-type multidrug transport system ATPase subunit